jgi:hypothetical protein
MSASQHDEETQLSRVEHMVGGAFACLSKGRTDETEVYQLRVPMCSKVCLLSPESGRTECNKAMSLLNVFLLQKIGALLCQNHL